MQVGDSYDDYKSSLTRMAIYFKICIVTDLPSLNVTATRAYVISLVFIICHNIARVTFLPRPTESG